MHAIDFIAGVEPYDSTIDVEVRPMGEETRMMVTLHPYPDPHWTRTSPEGFRDR